MVQRVPAGWLCILDSRLISYASPFPSESIGLCPCFFLAAPPLGSALHHVCACWWTPAHPAGSWPSLSWRPLLPRWLVPRHASGRALRCRPGSKPVVLRQTPAGDSALPRLVRVVDRGAEYSYLGMDAGSRIRAALHCLHARGLLFLHLGAGSCSPGCPLHMGKSNIERSLGQQVQCVVACESACLHVCMRTCMSVCVYRYLNVNM